MENEGVGDAAGEGLTLHRKQTKRRMERRDGLPAQAAQQAGEAAGAEQARRHEFELC